MTFKIFTLGCKVNQYEGQLLYEKLSGAGLLEPDNHNADIYIVNTCTVTHKADQESAGLIRSLHRQDPKAKIFVTGCGIENSQLRLEDIEGVSGIIHNKEKEKVLDYMPAHPEVKKKLHPSSISKFQKHTRAFLKIQDGCNNYCSYCIVPKVRGRSKSRLLKLIIEEAKTLVKNGYREIVLCGICLGAYGKDFKPPKGLINVIEELEKISGLLRIRLSSIEASDIDEKLIDKLAKPGKLCRHLHIPFQSGDDKILKLMNRKFSSKDYLNLVSALRKKCPDIAITTDIIVGFPQEEDKHFQGTINFLKKIKPSRMHVFSFSPRKGTPAFNFTARPLGKAAKDRTKSLKALAKELSADFYQRFIGKTLSVLVESENQSAKGYSDNYIKVYLPVKKYTANTIIKARIARLYRDGLWAQ